jgi:glutamate--cysteine ligase
MPKVGTKGLDMMLRTCTIQVNLDFSSEADMVKKFRTSLALQPLATAIFANSPFIEGQPSGYMSSRAAAWIDTDAARSGVPAAVFDQGFGYEQWVDYLLDVPMYFIHDGDSYKDAAGLSFRDFMAGKLPGYEGRLPVISDWEDHTTTAFPEVRLKRFLEMRGADGGDWGMICALPAFWVGLLYDEEALDVASDLIKNIGPDDVLNARMSAAKDGLRGKLGVRDMADLAKQVLKISEQGLRRRQRLNDIGDDESTYLQPIMKLADRGETQADRLLASYHNEWKQDIKPLYDVHRLKS